MSDGNSVVVVVIVGRFVRAGGILRVGLGYVLVLGTAETSSEACRGVRKTSGLFFVCVCLSITANTRSLIPLFLICDFAEQETL